MLGSNGLEQAYAALAVRFAALARQNPYGYSPESMPIAIGLCERIHPGALDSQGSGAFSYLRSVCFSKVAAAAHQPELCSRVRVLASQPPVRVPPGLPPALRAPAARTDPVTPESCRSEANRGAIVGAAVIGNRTLLLLLGYTQDEVTAALQRPPDYAHGFTDFLSAVLPSNDLGEEAEELAPRSRDFIWRLERLPDFGAGDDAAAHLQLDALWPGWSSPADRSLLARILRCAVERPAPDTGPAGECVDLLSEF
jgi:hypothetical protein